MRNSIRKTVLGGLIAGVLTLIAIPLWACSVPVFRYALEKWQSDAYEAVVFHRGELTGEALTAVEQLSQNGLAGKLAANVRVRTVDLDAETDAAVLEFWQQLGSPDLPHLVLRYPPLLRNPGIAWSGPLTASNVQVVLDSPVRQEVGERLIKGETAVWILLEGSDPAENEKAYQTLQEGLKQLEATLELPEISAEDIAQGLVSVDPAELKLKFSLIRVQRNEPAEQALVQMLLGSEPDLAGYDEPMAFPVFGRGRALYALVGAGINQDMLSTAGADLTGPCTCTIKEQNPGTDLLMAVDWESLVVPTSDGAQAPPPLIAVTDPRDKKEPASPEVLAIPRGRAATGNQVHADQGDGHKPAAETEIVAHTEPAPAQAGLVASESAETNSAAVVENAGLSWAVLLLGVVLIAILIVFTQVRT